MGLDLDGSQKFPNILSLCIASLLYAFICALSATDSLRMGKLVLIIIIVLFVPAPILLMALMVNAISRGSP
jgi:multisubunit Na+/H+ antiporter MnhG subunit